MMTMKTSKASTISTRATFVALFLFQSSATKSSSSAKASSSYHQSPLHRNGGKVKTSLLQKFSLREFGLGGGGKDEEREREIKRTRVGMMKRAQNETTFHENSGSFKR